MKNFLLLTLVLAASQQCVSQNTFEFLYSWGDSINTEPGKIKELSNGDLLILGSNSIFYNQSVPSKNILDETGTSLIRLAPNGQVVWRECYFNSYSIYNSFLDFCLTEQEEILIPKWIQTGYVQDTLSGFSIYNSFLLRVNSLDGSVIDTVLVGNDSLLHSGFNYEPYGFVLNAYGDSIYIDLRKESVNRDIKVLDQSLELKHTYQVDSFPWGEFDPYFKRIVSDTPNGVILGDFINNKRDTLLLPSTDSTSYFGTKFGTNGEYHIVSFFNLTDTTQKLALYNQQGSVVSQILTLDRFVNAVAISEDNIILVVSGEMDGGFPDSLSNQIRVSQYDIDLNFVGFRDYGLPYVLPLGITFTQDSCFFVSGMELTGPFNLKSGKSTSNVWMNNKLYVLKDKIKSLGIEGPQSQNKFSIYPNPGNDYLFIDAKLPNNTPLFELFDLYGRLCKTRSLVSGPNRITTLDLPQGIYLYKITNKENILSSGKWVKQ